MATTPQMNEEKAEEFAGKMMSILNDAALALLISVGHRTGLIDTMADMPPSTSEQIATAAKLQERYVREWLGGMVVGRIVEYTPVQRNYRLPPEHAAFLTRAAGTDNMATFTQIFPLVGLVEDKVVESFHQGGGVPYSAYPKFQQLQAEFSALVHDNSLVNGILPLVSGLVEKLSQGIDVADIGCGQGHAVNLMAQAFPTSRFVGYDFSEEGTASAREEATAWGITNATFEVKDVAQLGVRNRYDFMTSFDAIHDQAHPGQVLMEIANALKPGGTYLMVDEGASSYLEENLDHPIGVFLYAASVFHCMTVSLAQGGEGLGTVWGVQVAQRMLEEACLKVEEIKRVEGDIENAYFIATKPN